MFSRFVTIMATIVVVAPAGGASAQVSPKSPAFVAARTTFYLCPNLIRTKVAPPADELAKLDLVETAPQDPGTMWFKSTQAGSTLLFTFDPAKQQCITNYAGEGYEQIARLTRDIATKTTFSRITGGDKDGAKADVLEGPVTLDPRMIARVIIIENYRDGSAAISYSERAK